MPNIADIYCRTMSIDVNSGDIRREGRLGSFVVYSETAQTRFSVTVRRFGLDKKPPNWHVTAAKYFPSSGRVDFVYTGSVEECDSAAVRILDYTAGGAEQKRLTEEYLAMLRVGSIPDMRLDTEHFWKEATTKGAL